MSQVEKRIKFCLNSLKGESIGQNDPLVIGLTSQEILGQLAQRCDPCNKGSNLPWILKVYRKGNFIIQDSDRVKRTLEMFSKGKKSLPVDLRDLNKFANLDALQEEVRKFEEEGISVSKREEKKALKLEGARLVLQSEEGKLIEVLEYEAARIYGAGTRWCTTELINYNNYRNGLFIALLENGRKYQFHRNTSMFMDEQDYRVSKDEIARYQLGGFFAKSFVKTGSFSLLTRLPKPSESEENWAVAALSEFEFDEIKEGLVAAIDREGQEEDILGLFPNINASNLDSLFDSCGMWGMMHVMKHPLVTSEIVSKALLSESEELVSLALASEKCPIEHALAHIETDAQMLAVASNPNLSTDKFESVLLKAEQSEDRKLAVKVAHRMALRDRLVVIKACVQNRSLWHILPKDFMETPKAVLLQLSQQPDLSVETRKALFQSKSLNFEEISHVDLDGIRLDLSYLTSAKKMDNRIFGLATRTGSRMEILRALDFRSATPEEARGLIVRGYAETVALHPKTGKETLDAIFEELPSDVKDAVVLRKAVGIDSIKNYIQSTADGKRAIECVLNPGVQLDQRKDLLDSIYERRAELGLDEKTAAALVDASNKLGEVYAEPRRARASIRSPVTRRQSGPAC